MVEVMLSRIKESLDEIFPVPWKEAMNDPNLGRQSRSNIEHRGGTVRLPDSVAPWVAYGQDPSMVHNDHPWFIECFEPWAAESDALQGDIDMNRAANKGKRGNGVTPNRAGPRAA